MIMGNVIEVTTKQLRVAHKLHQMVKNDDPETDVTEHLIRKLLENEEIPVVSSGCNRMGCYEDLCAYLYEGRRWK